ncbi:hypothetical protein WDL1CHR_02410 [Variovorax sp. WDL1]|nr:hypothetical protein CHC06_04843 [Variovorax sp. B2]PNG54069.1 hypothetical protein CHC07_03893 [Variovorax sp. B4]VTV11541.1 hypothetical protein WDL1CHR_02410 [Variovorax sp. WDL1]
MSVTLLPAPAGEGWSGGMRSPDSYLAVGLRLGPGFRPGGRVTFFVSPKKVTKERRPHCARPSASLRATCGARSRRGPRKLASLKHARPFIRLKLRSSARAEGIWDGPSLRSATNGLAARGLEQVHAYARIAVHVHVHVHEQGPAAHANPHPTQGRAMARWNPNPLWPRRGAELFAEKGPRVFEPKASLRGPREKRAPQVARSEAEGRGQWGRLFFGYFLLARQKKVTRLPGRRPGSSLRSSATHHQAPSTPTLSGKGREQEAHP